jgi:antitoxin VapB
MALNIRNPEASQLAAEVAAFSGESKTDGSRQAARSDAQDLLAHRLDQIALRCAARAMRDQRTAEQILGYDAHGLPS